CRVSAYSVFSICDAPDPPDIHTLSLHDALPILSAPLKGRRGRTTGTFRTGTASSGETKMVLPLTCTVYCEAPITVARMPATVIRSEEHTSELQSPDHLVCRLLLEKKNKHRRMKC